MRKRLRRCATGILSTSVLLGTCEVGQALLRTTGRLAYAWDGLSRVLVCGIPHRDPSAIVVLGEVALWVA